VLDWSLALYAWDLRRRERWRAARSFVAPDQTHQKMS
jgi:hypothetical protein